MNIFWIYLVMSLITFVVYGLDKLKAKKGWWRIPEAMLHMLEFAFGWPGAWMGQIVFRHKTQKRSFRVMFGLMVVANIIVCAYLL